MSHDYSPLGSAADLPGDPDETAELAKRYTDTAQEILAAADRLTRIARAVDDGSWKGLAGSGFQSKSGDLAQRIRKAHERYAVTGRALAEWADEMRGAQAAAAAAAAAARSAESTVAAHPPAGPRPAGAPPATAAELAAAHASEVARSDATADLATAKRAFHDAVDRYNEAAHRTARAIRDVSEHDGQKDSWFYKHFSEIGKILLVLSIIVVAIAVVALVLACPAVLAAIAALPMVGGVLGAGAAAFGTALAAAGTAIEVAGAVLAVTTLAVDLQGRREGLDVSTRTLVIDAAVVLTFGAAKLLTLVKVGRVADAAVAVERGQRAEAAARAVMDGWRTSLREAPLLGKVGLLLKWPRTVLASGSAGEAAGKAFVASLEETAAGRLTLSELLSSRSIETATKLNELAELAKTEPELRVALATAARAAKLAGGATSAADVYGNASALYNAWTDYLAEHHLPVVERHAETAYTHLVQHTVLAR